MLETSSKLSHSYCPRALPMCAPSSWVRVCAICGFRGHSNCVDLNPHVRDSTSINLFRIYAAQRHFAPLGSCENHWRSVRAQASALAPQSDPTSLCVAHSLASNDMIFGELSLFCTHALSLLLSFARQLSRWFAYTCISLRSTGQYFICMRRGIPLASLSLFSCACGT